MFISILIHHSHQTFWNILWSNLSYLFNIQMFINIFPLKKKKMKISTQSAGFEWFVSVRAISKIFVTAPSYLIKMCIWWKAKNFHEARFNCSVDISQVCPHESRTGCFHLYRVVRRVYNRFQIISRRNSNYLLNPRLWSGETRANSGGYTSHNSVQ